MAFFTLHRVSDSGKEAIDMRVSSVVNVDVGVAIFSHLAASDVTGVNPPSKFLAAVADAENRNAEIENSGIDVFKMTKLAWNRRARCERTELTRCAFVVHRRWACNELVTRMSLCKSLSCKKFRIIGVKFNWSPKHSPPERTMPLGLNGRSASLVVQGSISA